MTMLMVNRNKNLDEPKLMYNISFIVSSYLFVGGQDY
jgi:hypothetical protein